MSRRGWGVSLTMLAMLLGVALAALLASERGLHWALQLVQRAMPGELKWDAAHGRLIGPLQLEAVSYRDAQGEYRSARVSFDWAPGRLLARRLSVHTLHLDGVEIALADAADDSATAPIAPGWSLPLEIVVRDLAVNGLRIRRGAQALFDIDAVNLAAASGLEWLDVQAFSLRMAQGEFAAQGRIGLGADTASDLAVDWRAQLPGYAPLAGHGRIAGTWEHLSVEQSVTAPQPAQLHATIEQPFAQLRWDAELALPETVLRAINADWPELAVGGRLRADGTLDTYRVELTARSAGAGLPEAAVNARAQGDSAALRIDALDVQTLDGTLHGQGSVAWAPHVRWEMQFQADGIDPGKHWPDWPGRLSAQFVGRGEVKEQLALEARIDTLAGQLRDYPVQGSGAFALEGDSLRFDAVRLQSGAAVLVLAGSIAAQWDVRWQLQAPDLEQLLPDYAGAANVDGTLSGERRAPRLRAQAQLRDLATADMRIGELRLAVDASQSPQAPLRIEARGQNLLLAERRFAAVALDIDGRLAQHVLQLQAQGAEQAMRLDARGGWDGAQWRGRVERADWRIPEAGAWSLSRPAALRLGAAQGALEQSCWTQAETRLCAEFDYDARERRLQAELSDWPIPALRALLPPDVRLDTTALSARLQARQPAAGAAQLDAQAQLSPGRVRWQERGQRRETAFGGGKAQLTLDAAGARSTLQLRFTGSDQLTARMALPDYRLGAELARQRLEGRLDGEVRDFALLDGLVEGVDDLTGVLRLDAALSGTPAEPQLQGGLSLREGRLFVAASGTQLEDLQLTLSDDGAQPLGTGALRLQGSARSGPGQVNLEGRLAQAEPDAGMQIDLQLSGADFEAVNLPEARVLVTPDLRASVRGRDVTVEGEVQIPEARIEPRDLSGAVTPSRDVVRLDVPQPVPSAWTVNSRVRVSLGERVNFAGYGLRGRLTGAVDIVDEAGKQPRARGELAVKDGSYTAYGQELKIDQGRVLYRDSPLDNPGLDVRATRKSGSVLAGVRVLGTAHKPQAELYSQPPLPQAEALSYLLLGQPMANASGSEGEMLYKAASSLGLKGGNQLAQSIGSRFGLDQVSVGGSDLEGAVLTVGKYLAPRLYLNYSIGLLDAANKLQLRYQLTKHLSVQTEAGAEAGGDLLYTIER